MHNYDCYYNPFKEMTNLYLKCEYDKIEGGRSIFQFKMKDQAQILANRVFFQINF